MSFSKRPTFTKIQYGKDRPPQSIQIASEMRHLIGDTYDIGIKKLQNGICIECGD